MIRFRPPLSALLLALVAGSDIGAQSGPPNGPRQVDPRWHVFRGATLIPEPGARIDDATVVIRDGVIVSVAAGGEAPAGARVWDCQGQYVYAGLIEPYLPVKAPPPDATAADVHWNPAVVPQRSALDGAGPAAKTAEQLRNMGFAAAALVPDSGVFRGRGAVVLLGDQAEAEGVRHRAVVRRDAFHGVAFDRSGSGYPRSRMGCVAVVRQVLHDAERHAHNQAIYAAGPAGLEPPPVNAAFAALGSAADPASAPLLFDIEDELEALTALRTAAEFGRAALVVGTGTEYRRLTALAAAEARLILPLDFPETPAVASLAEAEAITLRELLSWEHAPANPRRVIGRGLTAALTTHRLEKRTEFPERLRQAVQHGLSTQSALAMLTTTPAAMLGVTDQLGSVAAGKIANLVIANGPLFAEDTRVLDVWVRGQRHVVHDPAAHDLEGRWTVSSADRARFAGTLAIRPKKKVALELGEEKKLRARKVTVGRDSLDFVVDGEDLELPGAVAVHGVQQGDELFGTARAPDGTSFVWSAVRADSAADEDEGKATELVELAEQLPVPLGAYGALNPPQDGGDLYIHNATVWLVGPALEILEPASVFVRDGRIQWIGDPDIVVDKGDARVIDGTGKHLTPGLIDCHSHTGIRGGVNEGTQAVTAEVRIQDSLDPDDISWYRQLAGGVTMVQQLHGSANPIGGQSNLVKLRWGVTDPQRMRVRGGKLGIKFALGENVKRARRSGPSRYPTSRMGVEALIRDRFTAAREYARSWQRYQRMAPDEQAGVYRPRRDLELDALTEILGGLRMVHCHAYRQDEILMLCRVARDFGFKIGTFQHALEGYKVAEAISESALGASVFSDWWAYKFEVFDAIPHNGAILRKTGVFVSFNSDSNELARRLNTEAAKAMKYGDLDRQAALAFVTMGPAYQLGMHERVGSIAVGKDGDLALWSGDPLSPFSRCEATFIDGVEYFSLEQDRAHRARAETERQRLLQKVLARAAAEKDGEKKDGEKGADTPGDAPGSGPRAYDEAHDHCGQCSDAHAETIEQQEDAR